jgi:hypothetical protein
MAAFLANVGVNASHAARSPLFGDGSFRLLPILEAGHWSPPMLRLADRPELARHAPNAWHDRPVHLDPDLQSPTPTYGDNCRRAARAFTLRHAASGDLIVFLARLRATDGRTGFYLVGRLEIANALADVTTDPGPGWWDANAHVRRARARETWDSFWVFKGTRRSQLLATAVLLDRPTADALFGTTWTWRPNRSELQTIGSYTRTVRRLNGAHEARLRSLVDA